MPPFLALTLTVAFSMFMLRRHVQDPANPSSPSWIPVIWIFFAASRPPSQWLSLLGFPYFMGSLEEGSPLEAVFFLILILLGIGKLKSRHSRLSAIFRENMWLTLFFAYCFLAVFWSDFPFVALKRWIKTAGHPVMALLILTESQPQTALRVTLKRAAYIMLPLSVAFIKYYPEYARGFDEWTGRGTNRGISYDKNGLGNTCMVFGIFFVWNLLLARTSNNRTARRTELCISVFFLGMTFWLLHLANSATSLVGLVIGCCTVAGLGLAIVSKRHFGAYVITIALLVAGLEMTVGLYEPTLRMLGRSATLTDRTEVWGDVLTLMQSPILGTGFESFWLGDRLKTLWNKWWWHPTQAHNGYIETYLNLGAVGLILLIAALIATFRKISTQFANDFMFARLRMGFFFAIIFYNFTEATFKALSFIYTVFYVISLDTPSTKIVDPAESNVDSPRGLVPNSTTGHL
jgi:exopolysaccharide production protein ExoQ